MKTIENTLSFLMVLSFLIIAVGYPFGFKLLIGTIIIGIIFLTYQNISEKLKNKNRNENKN